ncbi:MAG TPA: helix-turn-helix domain-containing protein [Mycobacteriales bacterium]|nr:helix-turn-helix domain-containing protein [Mycobacteriales bacterium]
MSSGTVDRAPRRQAGRAADTVARLTAAAVEELQAVGYDRLTVRAVARRAGVAPATAYTWFASKDHLVAEAFWRAIQALPSPRRQAGTNAASRVRAAMDGIGRLSADDSALAAAATAALLASDPDVARLRRRIGAAVHQRLVDALGADADPAVVEALDMLFAGALLHAGLGLFPYAEFADRMARVTALLTGAGR